MAIGDVRGYKCSVDYYNVLRVPKDADRLVIKSAFRQLAVDFHPDKKDGCLKATETMKKINVAHEVLIDPDKKKAYDAMRSKHVHGRACLCQVLFEEPSIWSQPEKSLVKAKASIICHCKNCDPGTKALKEKARSEAERARKEKMERERSEKERLEREEKEKKWAEAKRIEQERKEKERLEGERIRQEQERQRQELERAKREEAERLAKAKFDRKRRVSDQIEEEHVRREEKRLKQVEELRLKIECKQQLRKEKAAAGPFENPQGTTNASVGEPEYSTYWSDNETMTPYFRSIREDFDRAMRRHKHATDQLSRLGTVEEMERQADVVESRWKDLEAKSFAWADASSVANRMMEEAKAHKESVRI